MNNTHTAGHGTVVGRHVPGGLVEEGLVRELGGLVERLLGLARQHQLPTRAHVDVQGLGVGQAWLYNKE